jgi:hypothetical protein
MPSVPCIIHSDLEGGSRTALDSKPEGLQSPHHDAPDCLK